MKISDVLRSKGSEVVTISPEDTVRQLLEKLSRYRLGALVVTSGGTMAGIVSERDVVRHLYTTGDEILDGPVGAIMTSVLHTAGPRDTVDDLMRLMTAQRIRHVPVMDEGRMAGIVSIGDMVNQCITELRDERDQLTAYINN
jgi:CBS domain-containing protein